LNRVVVLSGKLEKPHLTSPLGERDNRINIYNKIYSEFLSKYNLKSALDETFIFLDSLNKIVDTEKPWELIKNNPEKAEEVLFNLAE
jgi:methionyl-tRNA synthetase